jgi:hypothetical protein
MTMERQMKDPLIALREELEQESKKQGKQESEDEGDLKVEWGAKMATREHQRREGAEPDEKDMGKEKEEDKEQDMGTETEGLREEFMEIQKMMMMLMKEADPKFEGVSITYNTMGKAPKKKKEKTRAPSKAIRPSKDEWQASQPNAMISSPRSRYQSTNGS